MSCVKLGKIFCQVKLGKLPVMYLDDCYFEVVKPLFDLAAAQKASRLLH